MSCLGINLLRRQGGVSENFARKAVLAKLGASTTLDNSNYTRILQHLSNIRPSFERYGCMNAIVTLVLKPKFNVIDL